MSKTLLTLACLASLALAGCATVPPTAVSHQHTSSDGVHWAVQITMHSGVPNTPQQTVMIVYNKFSKVPIATVDGQTKPLGEKLFDDLVSILAASTPAAIGGNYALLAAEANCPPGTLCGTLVQVQNTAGAQADADSETTQTTNN